MPTDFSPVQALLAAQRQSASVRVFDLGRPLFAGMPQSPNHPPFRMALQRRHGDSVRADGSSAANELIVTGGHVGTHIDGLSHVSYQGCLHGGISATEAQTGGRFSQLGVETIEPMVCRGVLLDVAAAKEIESCPAGYEITAKDLIAASGRQRVTIHPGDVVLIRSGWGRYFDDPDRFVGHDSGVPGPGEGAARWLSNQAPVAIGGETIAFECIPAGQGHALLPVHRHLLFEMGIYIIEALDLEELSTAGIAEFTFILSPLKVLGGTGSPVRPLAVVIDDPVADV
jgi:kynurenine formamidase